MTLCLTPFTMYDTLPPMAPYDPMTCHPSMTWETHPVLNAPELSARNYNMMNCFKV